MGWSWVLALVACIGCGRIAFDPTAAADDAVTGDGSGSANVNVAFVTSTDVPPSTLGGLLGADAICEQRAAAAGLPPNTYVAWLSTSTVDAKSRLAGARGWVRTDGLPFADTLDGLLTGGMRYPLRVDENRNDRSNTPTPTGTNRNGVFHAGGTTQCADFTGPGTSTYGWPDGGTAVWTEQQFFDCSTPGPLYCFGIDYQSEVTIAPVSGRRAFISYTGFGAMTGLAGADAICASEAMDAGLPGTFLALLADDGATAASRFSLAGGPWYRVDGVELTSDLVTVCAPINLHADGVWVNVLAWTGAASPATPGTMASTCNGWMSSAAMGVTGTIGRSASMFFGGGSISCSLGPGVYCFQQ